ncbi:RNA ligase family protein [Haladaptatus salinisoli]|uniref:RNA ligase family protein n=1 Tax=Haladaptatus salinisoli TaxID=2884876 RepID=UPI001D0A8CFB|nr:RNA ligase family protein [Haladaptatus salinisoli]
MKTFPPSPRVEDAPPELFESGHLWIQELIDGASVRFRLRESGAIRFGDRRRTYDADEIPPAYRHAARRVRENLDRSALRTAVDGVEAIVFLGVATHRRDIDYDWERTPSFLGVDVWSAVDERFLPPDAVEGIFRRLGLAPVNAFEKEVRAVDFDPDAYEVPRSNWYDGPAKGVVLRNKTGSRAELVHPDFEATDDAPLVDAPAEELARRYATDSRFERIASELEREGRPATVDALRDGVFESIAREERGRPFRDDRGVDVRAFRSELASLAQRFAADRG